MTLLLLQWLCSNRRTWPQAMVLQTLTGLIVAGVSKSYRQQEPVASKQTLCVAESLDNTM